MSLNHSRFRLAFVLSIRAPFVAIACSLGAPTSAADVNTISYTRPPNPFTLIHTLRERSQAQRSAEAGVPALPHQVAAQSGVLRPVPIQDALDLLKWSPDHVPMIEVVDVCPPGVSLIAQGWTVYDGNGKPRPTIYVAGWSALYRAILANRLDVQYNLIRLAGVLAHERAHIEHGQNEEWAYLAQLTTLEHLRAHDIDIANVRRALEAVKRQQHRRR